MSKTSDAVDTLRRMAVQFQGIVDAADILEKVGVADAAIAEKQRHLEQVRADHALASDALLKVHDATKQARDASALLLRDADESASKMIDDAKTQAAQILADAKTQAANELAAEKAQRVRLLKELNDEIKDAQDDLTTLRKVLSDTHGEHKSVEKHLAATKAELDEIQVRVRKMVGA